MRLVAGVLRERKIASSTRLDLQLQLRTSFLLRALVSETAARTIAWMRTTTPSQIANGFQWEEGEDIDSEFSDARSSCDICVTSQTNTS